LALAEAASRTTDIRRSDAQFRYVVLALAAMYLGVGSVIAFIPRRGGSPVGSLLILTIFVGGLALIVLLTRRVRAFSRPGLTRFAIVCSSFAVWNLAVLEIGIFGGWFGAQSPGWHFTVTAAIGSIPLLVAGLLLAPRRG
jgi:hypothetical protein